MALTYNYWVKLTDAAVLSLNRHMTCSIGGDMPDNTLKESKIHHFSNYKLLTYGKTQPHTLIIFKN